METSFISEALERFRDDIHQTFDEKLKRFIVERLKVKGFKFSSDQQLFNFLRDRIVRINFEETRDTYEFYLDYTDENNRGEFIGGYKMNVSTEFQEASIKAITQYKFY